MNLHHLQAVALALAIYLMLAISYIGWGATALRVLGIGANDPDYPSRPLAAWLGWAVTLLVFQILHFFLPLNAAAVLPVLGLGAILFVPAAIVQYRRWRGGAYAFTWKTAALAAVLLPAAAAAAGFVATQAMMPEMIMDSGLYHYNKIRWLNEYPLVPGLANLHMRLGFNSAFFHYTAALNVYPYFNHGRSIANSFLYVLTAAYLIGVLLPVFRNPRALLEAHPFRYVPALFCLPYMLYLARFSPELSSPTPDFAPFLLQMILFAELARGIEAWTRGERRQHGRAVAIALLAGSAIAVKASNLAFAGTIFVFLLWYAIVAAGRRPLALAAGLLFLMGGVWIATNYMLSGAPLYPSNAGRIEFDWAIPADRVTELQNWILSWARQPMRHWSKVIGHWDWFMPWFGSLLLRPYLCHPLFAAFGLAVAVGVTSLLRRTERPRLLEWSLGLPVAAGLVFWFFTAPATRFAEAMLFLLPIFLATLLLCSEQRMVRGWRLALAAAALFAAINWQLGSYFLKAGSGYFHADAAGWQTAKKEELRQKTTTSGLKLYLPKGSNRSWDAPLPCTPYFDPNLRLRDPQDMAAGFTVQPPEGGTPPPSAPTPKPRKRPSARKQPRK